MESRSLSVSATLDSLSEIASFVMQAADDVGLGQRERYRLRLAVDELVTNIIMHGYGSHADPSRLGAIVLRAEADDRELRVIVEDATPPFDPSQVPPPDDLHRAPEERKIGGLGVYLATTSVDRFAYERLENRNRSVLIMNRPRPDR